MFTIYGVLIVAIIAISVVLLARGGVFIGSWSYGRNSGNVELKAGLSESCDSNRADGIAGD